MPVLLKVVEGALRRIDRQVREVRAAEPFELGVEVRKIAALKQRVVGEIDARNDVLRHERDLFRLGEEVLWHPVQHQPSHGLRRQQLFRNELRRVQDVEIEGVGKILVECLQA